MQKGSYARGILIRSLCIVGCLVMLSGCAAPSSTPSNWSGPAWPASTSESAWTYRETPGSLSTTPHYRIYTTLPEAEFDEARAKIAQVMEGALEQYRTLAPGIALTDHPLDCYVFGLRKDWADFTARHTGKDAPVYLQVTRGGYAFGDIYVAHYGGETASYAVAAHEGWHQFVARHFKGHLPPFLEEGIATMFEAVRWENGLPRWNLSVNLVRLRALHDGVAHRQLWPLSELMTMHAGQIVGEPPERIELFYAQCWAFARFLREESNGRYQPALAKLVSDTAAGASSTPATVGGMFQRYLATDPSTLEREYTDFVGEIIKSEYNDL